MIFGAVVLSAALVAGLILSGVVFGGQAGAAATPPAASGADTSLKMPSQSRGRSFFYLPD